MRKSRRVSFKFSFALRLWRLRITWHEQPWRDFFNPVFCNWLPGERVSLAGIGPVIATWRHRKINRDRV